MMLSLRMIHALQQLPMLPCHSPTSRYKMEYICLTVLNNLDAQERKERVAYLDLRRARQRQMMTDCLDCIVAPYTNNHDALSSHSNEPTKHKPERQQANKASNKKAVHCLPHTMIAALMPSVEPPVPHAVAAHMTRHVGGSTSLAMRFALAVKPGYTRKITAVLATSAALCRIV